MTQYFEINKMPLHVLTSSGFNITPGIDIKETELLPDTRTNNAPTFYFSSGNHGVEFEVSVVIKETYYFKTDNDVYYPAAGISEANFDTYKASLYTKTANGTAGEYDIKVITVNP